MAEKSRTTALVVGAAAAFVAGGASALLVHYCVWLRRYSPSKEMLNWGGRVRHWDGSYHSWISHEVGMMRTHGTLEGVLEAQRIIQSTWEEAAVEDDLNLDLEAEDDGGAETDAGPIA